MAGVNDDKESEFPSDIEKEEWDEEQKVLHQESYSLKHKGYSFHRNHGLQELYKLKHKESSFKRNHGLQELY